MPKRSRVLVVDDDRDVLDALADMIPEGVLALKADNVFDALQIIQTQSLDAVLLDISLGQSNGLALLAKLRSKHISVPIVMMSGNATKENALTALHLGAHDLIEKPIRQDYFDRQLPKVIAAGQGRRHIKSELESVTALIGDAAPGELDFVKDYLSLLEARRAFKAG